MLMGFWKDWKRKEGKKEGMEGGKIEEQGEKDREERKE